MTPQTAPPWAGRMSGRAYMAELAARTPPLKYSDESAASLW